MKSKQSTSLKRLALTSLFGSMGTGPIGFPQNAVEGGIHPFFGQGHINKMAKLRREMRDHQARIDAAADKRGRRMDRNKTNEGKSYLGRCQARARLRGYLVDAHTGDWCPPDIEKRIKEAPRTLANPQKALERAREAGIDAWLSAGRRCAVTGRHLVFASWDCGVTGGDS